MHTYPNETPNFLICCDSTYLTLCHCGIESAFPAEKCLLFPNFSPYRWKSERRNRNTAFTWNKFITPNCDRCLSCCRNDQIASPSNIPTGNDETRTLSTTPEELLKLKFWERKSWLIDVNFTVLFQAQHCTYFIYLWFVWSAATPRNAGKYISSCPGYVVTTLAWWNS